MPCVQQSWQWKNLRVLCEQGFLRCASKNISLTRGFDAERNKETVDLAEGGKVLNGTIYERDNGVYHKPECLKHVTLDKEHNEATQH